MSTKTGQESESFIKNNTGRRNVFYLLSSSSIITFAHTMFNLTVMWIVYEKTQSALLTSAIATITHLAAIFGGPLAGYFVDRHSPKKILQYAYLTISIGLLLLAVFYYLFPSFLIYILFLILILIDFTNTLSYPAENRLIPRVIPSNQLHKINGLSISIDRTASLLGNSVSGFILAFFGLLGSILIDSFAFFIASIFILLIKLSKPDSRITGLESSENPSETQPNMFKSLVEGIKFINGNPLIKRLVIMAFFLNAASFIYPLYIVLINESYDVGARGYGIFQAMGVVGSILGGLCVPFFKKRWSITNALGFSFLATCLGTIILGLNNIFIIALVIFFIMNIFITIQNVFTNVFFMTAVPDDLRGRVMGTMVSLSSLGIPLFVLLGGFLADILQVKWMFVIAGIWFGLFSIYMFTNKGIKDAISKTNMIN